MRNTRGKPTAERILLGDASLAEKLADALAAEDRLDRYTHGFHAYPAGLHPDAARDLLALFEAERVLDPFCGGGTVLVEAMVAGKTAIGCDIGPTALRVARARTAVLSDEQLTRLRSAARKLADVAKPGEVKVPDELYQALSSWYDDHALRELVLLKQGINDSDPEVRPLLEAVFSAIVVKVSWRRSDTNAQRVKHDRPPKTTAILFHKKTRELARKLVALREACTEDSRAEVRHGDARHLTVDRPVDLVLTSPPYPSTYDYLLLQHLRNVWFGDHPDGKSEIGPRRDWRQGAGQAHHRWSQDTLAWTRAAAGAVAPGGKLLVVIGDGLTPAGPVDASEATEQSARKVGLRSVARASLERPDYARGTSRWEHVFCFEKPHEA